MHTFYDDTSSHSAEALLLPPAPIEAQESSPKDQHATTSSKQDSNSSSNAADPATEHSFAPPHPIDRLSRKPKAKHTRCIMKFWSELAWISSPVDDVPYPGPGTIALEDVLIKNGQGDAPPPDSALDHCSRNDRTWEHRKLNPETKTSTAFTGPCVNYMRISGP